jgi:hypothetical protein
MILFLANYSFENAPRTWTNQAIKVPLRTAWALI